MVHEMFDRLPEWVYIESSLDTFSIGDEFGRGVDDVVRELKVKDSSSVWAKRLALFEIARRKAWIRSFLSLSELGIDGLMYPRFYRDEILRLVQPGREVAWNKLQDEVRDKKVIFEHGSYRSIPTMAHVGYVNYGFVGQLGANINVLSLDSNNVIKGRKGKDKIVLSDQLRTAIWRHVPGVDVVTITPDFSPDKVNDFWVENAYPTLSRSASNVTIMCSYGDQIAEEKYRHARLNSRLDVRVVYRGNWYSEFGHPLYPQWTTTEWDEVSEKEEDFVNLAEQYLVDLG